MNIFGYQVINMLETFIIIKDMDMVNLHGSMELYIKDNGNKVINFKNNLII